MERFFFVGLFGQKLRASCTEEKVHFLYLIHKSQQQKTETFFCDLHICKLNRTLTLSSAFKVKFMLWFLPEMYW